MEEGLLFSREVSFVRAFERTPDRGLYVWMVENKRNVERKNEANTF